MMRLFYSLLFILGLQTWSHGQFNLSVLYSASLTEPNTHQSIIDQFHSDREWLQSTFDDMKWLNGFGFGLRYKFDRIAFDIKWENQINRLSASGIDPNTNDNFDQTLFYRFGTYGFGLESFFSEKLSIHASFDFTNARYRTEGSDFADKVEIMNAWGTGSTFSLGYNFVGNGLMHVSVRPFLHVSWKNHDLSELNESLNPDNTSITNVEEEFMNFGIKLIFYNGQW